MKVFNLAVLALLTLEGSQAFVPSNLQRHGPSIRATAVELSADADVSVPYDAAARLAYDDWCNTYGKPFDATRYEVFKDNYLAITVMNVSTKKQARESGDENPSLLALNEYADFTAEEYEAAMNGEGTVATTGDVLGKVVEAAESQSAASNALQEAADALAEDEEKLAAQLGLASVEELEAAIDEMEGIAPDGGVIEGDNLAREARVRSAYLEWCKEYGKESDETRFQQFSKNFLDMEEFAKETGKEMSLNEYADCTAKEYAALMEGEDAVKEAESAIKAAEGEIIAKAESATINAAEEAKKKAMEAMKAKALAAEAAATKKAQEAAESMKKAMEEKAKALAEKVRFASMSDEERRKEIETQKSARQSAQDKELELERQAAAAEAIKAAKAAEAAAAARIEKQRQLSEQAAEQLRAQARDWEAKQANLAPKPPKSVSTPPPKPSPFPSFSLGSILGSSSKEVAPAPAPRSTLNLNSFFGSAPNAPPAKAAPKKPAPSPVPRPSLSLDFLKKTTPPAPKPAAVAQAPKPVPKPAPVPKPVTIAKAPVPKPAPKPATVAKTPTPAPKPAPKSIPRATMSLTSLFKAPEQKAPAPAPKPELNLKPIPTIDTSDPVSDAFSAFFGGKKSTPPKAEVTPTPAVAPKKEAAPSFSFFSPKPAPKVAPPPPPAPAPKAAPSFFSSKPAPKPAPAPAPAPKPSFSLFGPKPVPKVEPTPAPAQAPKPFSFLGGSSPAAPKAPNASPKAAPASKAATPRPSLSLFGGPKGATKVAPKPAPVVVKNTAPKKAPPKDNIPVLSRWSQNADGSITGMVSNSPSFRNGTEITTSPVRAGAKAGSVVRTGSGSQYRLM